MYSRRAVEAAGGWVGRVDWDTMSEKKYTVTGMTCGHCELSVQEEVSEIDGVTSVDANHVTGEVIVNGEFTDDQVIEAIHEAGFELDQSESLETD